jgi:hypothetical protein
MSPGVRVVTITSGRLPGVQGLGTLQDQFFRSGPLLSLAFWAESGASTEKPWVTYVQQIPKLGMWRPHGPATAASH